MPSILRKLLGGSGPAALLDPRDPAFLADPGPGYRRLREADPVHRMELGWFVSRYDDADFVLNDRRFGHPGPARSGFAARLAGPVSRMRAVSLVSMNPPEHTRLKRVVTPLLAARSVQRLRPRIAEYAGELFERVRGAGRMDLIEDFAAPLPFGISCELLGVPEGDRARVWRLMQPLAGVFDVGPHGSLLQRWRAVGAIRDYFAGLVAERQRHPAGDGVSALIEARNTGSVRSDEELVATCVLLLEAGHLTTVQLLGNGVLALLRAPDQLERLRREPALVPSAVEELLRYGGPVRLVGRMAFEDVRIHDRTLSRGDTVYALLAAANRDPARFAEPERLDVGRRAAGHLAFGAGVHACPGALLARATAEEALALLLRHASDLELAAGRLDPLDLIFLQGWKSLPLRFAAS
jgi:cytochrome P450